tara:strand:+ start:98 stop:583 length:486 start_codon:yes stop_codon:yes gene_type:complete
MPTKIKKHTFRTAYNLGNENYTEKHDEVGLTEQHHADTCDINKILAQFMETGILPTSTREPVYGNVADHDFQEVQNQLAEAKSLFEQLPDPVKAQFDNEPFKFLHFAEDPRNLDALVEMGLANAPKKGSLEPSSTQAEDANSGTEIASDKPDTGASETVAT